MKLTGKRQQAGTAYYSGLETLRYSMSLIYVLYAVLLSGLLLGLQMIHCGLSLIHTVTCL